jgi:hypothetical protein
MKKMIDNTIETFQRFDILTENEMLQVRGGEDTRPRTRPLDIFDDETEGEG